MQLKKIDWKQFPLPALVFLLLGISYAVQAGKLGWYLDDWIILEAFVQGGLQRLNAYSFMVTRPTGSPLWLPGFWVAKFNPIIWQLWALFWRALLVVFIWLGWKKLFPDKHLIVGSAALLLTVYPIFDQQASALTFSFHWIAFTLWGVSFYLMLNAAKSEKYWAILTLSSVFAMTAQIFANEFFIGLEILRPIALFWLFRGEAGRLLKTIKQSIPYLIVLVGYLFWRLTLMLTPISGDRNAPIYLRNLFTNPLDSLFKLASMTFQSLLQGLGGVWYQTIDPTTFTIAANTEYLSWVVVFALITTMAFLLWRFRHRIPSSFANNSDISIHFMFIFGLLFFLAGIAPGLSIGRYLSPLDRTSDRFAMAAMPGAALMLTSLIWYLLWSQTAKILTMTILIALSVGFQFRLSNSYRHSWQKQERLFWQLLWRAPHVEPDTAFLGNGALAVGLGNWATASAFNMMYGDYDNPKYVPYWYVDLYRSENDNGAAPIDFSSAHLSFQWHKPQSIVFQYETDISPCVWVLDQQDANNPDLDPFVKKALILSDLSRISSDRSLPKPAFLDDELDHNWWCYFYQKGALAAQNENWDEVLSLYNLAQQQDHEPYASQELMPFIQAAFVHANWELAEEMTLQASSVSTSNDQFCMAWQTVRAKQPIPADVQSRLIENYRCTNLLEE